MTKQKSRPKKAEAELNREFVEHWRRAGPMLEQMRLWELRNYRYADHVEAIDSLLEIGRGRSSPRSYSGLVEFHRVLARGA